MAQRGPPISARTRGPSQVQTTTATLPDPVIVAHRLLAVLGALILVAATMVFGAPATSAVQPSGAINRPAGPTVSITDELSTVHLPVRPGATVTWVNDDSQPHRITSDKGASVEFDSGVLEPGERFSHTFAAAGDVTYHDALDPRNSAYAGMVMVQPASEQTGGSAGLSPQAFVAGNFSTSATPASFTTAAADLPSYVEVEIHNKNEFRPATVTIAKGGTVEWYNDHSDIHTATGAGGIDSGDLDRDQRYSKKFNTPGTYEYVCIYHERMVATVRVADANGNVPPPKQNDPGTPPPPSGGGQQVAVSIGSNFSPANVTVPAGSVVTWTNNDSAPHTATGPGFDSGMLTNGQRYSHTFSTPGTYRYDCAYHSNMVGTIQVQDASGEVPPGPPPGGGDGGGSTPPPPPGGGDGGGSTPPPPPGGGGGGGGTNAPATATVTVDDDFFSPKTVTVRAGGTVTWTNRGNYHTVTASNGAFDSGMLDTGRSFRHTFRAAGTYAYDCILHEGMTGTVRVVSSSGSVPPPDQTPGGSKKPSRPGKPKPGNPGGGPGGGGGSDAPSAGSKKHVITMGSSSFSPKVLNARVGDTVVFKNSSPVPHNAVPFTSATIMGGQSYTTVLRKQGTINYECKYHPGMTGTIKVGAAPKGVKLPPPSAETGISGPSAGGAVGGSSGSTGSSGGSSGAAPSPQAETHTIAMVNNTFDPQTLQARVGDEVIWVNEDAVPHNVTGGPLASDMIMGGGEFSTVLTEAGTIEYECTLHPGMTGTLEVAEALPGTKIPPASSSTTSSSSGSSGAAESSAGGESSASAKPEAGAKNHVVDIVDFLYEPDPLEAHVGDTVTFVNKDAAPHTATADDKSWDSGNMNQGDEWTLKLEETGEIPYFCIYHPNMTGTLIVKEKDEKLAAPGTSSSDTAGPETAQASAGQIAGFSSGWLALLALLAGLQLQARLAARRRADELL